jgi:hypothetical protein
MFFLFRTISRFMLVKVKFFMIRNVLQPTF